MNYNFCNNIILNLNNINKYINSYLLYTFFQDNNVNINKIRNYILSIPDICNNLKEMTNTLYEKANA